MCLGLLPSCDDLNTESSLREIKSHCFLVVAILPEGPDRRWEGSQNSQNGVHIIFHLCYLSVVYERYQVAFWRMQPK